MTRCWHQAQGTVRRSLQDGGLGSEYNPGRRAAVRIGGIGPRTSRLLEVVFFVSGIPGGPAATRAACPAQLLSGENLMSDRVPMTRDGYEKMKAELDRLENEDKPRIAERIAAARAEGDLSENAEYHGQREALGMLQARINRLKDRLSRASIVDPSKLPKDKVALGATVRVKDLDLDDEEEFTLVGAGEEDFDAGRYPLTGPIGQGLLGKKIGDRVAIPAPRGVINFEVLDIRFE
jgi:transcription elongation factor GreA